MRTVDRDIDNFDYDPQFYPRMGMLLKKKRQTDQDAGFFEIIHLLYNFDFLGVDSAAIDKMLWSRIALRSPAPIVVNVHDEDEGVRLTWEERVELARMLFAYYHVKWDKQKAVVSIEYDPIHNYLDEWSDTSEGEESKNGREEYRRTDTERRDSEGTSTRTDNLEQETQYGGSTTRTDNLTEGRQKSVEEVETDDLEKRTDFHSQDQRTDNLTELSSVGSGVQKSEHLVDQKTFDTTETTDQDGYKKTDFHSDVERKDDLTEDVSYGKTTTTTYPNGGLVESKQYGKSTLRSDNLTESDSGDSGTDEHQVYAFNSTQYKPADKQIHTNWGANTKTNSGTQTNTDSGTDTITKSGSELVTLGGKDTTENSGSQKTENRGYDEITDDVDKTVEKDGTETSEVNGTTTEQKFGSDTKTNSGTQVNAKSGYDTEATDGTISKDTTESETVANTGTQTTAQSGSDTVANTGTQTTENEETVQSTFTRNETNIDSQTGTSSRDRSGVHTGNIGNLTSQKMISEEIALWKWNFIEEVLSDATSFLTLQVYC